MIHAGDSLLLCMMSAIAAACLASAFWAAKFAKLHHKMAKEAGEWAERGRKMLEEHKQLGATLDSLKKKIMK